MTLNNIVKKLNDIAINHLQINHFFFGEEWDFATSGVVNCPAMIAVLEPATLEGAALTHSFKIYIGDLVQKDLANKSEVLSDCMLIALDIIYQLQLPAYDFVLINKNSITLNDFEDSFDNELYGYWFQIKLKLPAPYDRCAIPNLVPNDETGSTTNTTTTVTGRSEKGIVASATQTQADAYQLSKKTNRIDTCVTDLDSVKVFLATENAEFYIINSTLKTVNLYPKIGDRFKVGLTLLAINAPVKILSKLVLAGYCYEGDTGTFTIK